jgi:hypothetical protein
MSKVVRVKDGNYKIVVDNPSDNNGGKITLDTTGGYTTDRGLVVINGDLEVKGITTTVESTVVTLTDNIITVNYPEDPDNAPAGIPASLNYQGGLEVNRGSEPSVKFVWDESVPYVTGGSSGTGSFIIENNAGQYVPISFNSVNSQGDLYITTPNGGINVAGTVDYEKNVLTYSGDAIVDAGEGVIRNNDYVPNAKAMVDYVDYALSIYNDDNIAQEDTSVQTSDFDVSGTESNVAVTVDSIVSATFYTNRVTFSDLQIIGNEISTNDSVSNEDLILSANGTGTVKIKDVIEITETPGDDDILSDPSAPIEGVKIYSKTEDTGGSGIYFVNKNNTADELISRNRSLVFSMLF